MVHLPLDLQRGKLASLCPLVSLILTVFFLFSFVLPVQPHVDCDSRTFVFSPAQLGTSVGLKPFSQQQQGQTGQQTGIVKV